MPGKLLFAFFFFCSVIQAQRIDYSASLQLQGIFSSEEENPFWIQSNQRGRIDELTSLAGWLTTTGTYTLRNESAFEVGLGGLYQDGYTDKIQLDEYYASFKNEWFQAYAGRKQQFEYYRGLSATNENMLWSLNSRPIPGISFKTEPILLWETGGLGFKASWEEFFSDEKDRYIQTPRIHHKSFHLIFNKIRKLELIAGVHHYVQWAGKSSEYGELPASFEDYLKVITGGSIIGGEGLVGDQEINGLGNHLGGYEVMLNTSFSGYKISLIYNTLFEDMSGIKLRNTPDGRYGLFIEDSEQNKWIEAFMYEYYFTRNQSKNYPTTDGKDNYFNNHLYRSGWTYENRIIGLPFILLDEDRFRVEHNNIVAHHIGITGDAFYSYPYKFLASYRANYGAKGGSSKPIERIVSTYLDMNVWQEYVDVNFQVGADFNSDNSSNVGMGFRLSKTIF